MTPTAGSCPRSRRVITSSSPTPRSLTRCDRANATLDDIDRVAVTQGPGLVGALLVGVATAKAIAAARGLPLVPVDHLQGHVAANFLRVGEGEGPVMDPPFVCLIASGGHTLLARVEDRSTFTVLGRTLDDAAGEAFDKGARLLGLPFPGGPALERLARDGDPAAFAFPRRAQSRRAGLLVRRRQDVAAVPRPRARRGRGARARDRSRRELPARDRHGARRALRARAGADRHAAPGDRRRRRRERAAPRAPGGARRDDRDPAARAVHRQRRDDRLGGALRRRAPVPGLSRAGCVRLRRARPADDGASDSCCTRAPDVTCATTRALSLERVGEPFDEVDIETDDALHAAYLERIPVVTLDGAALFDYFVDEGVLRERLDRVAPR